MDRAAVGPGDARRRGARRIVHPRRTGGDTARRAAPTIRAHGRRTRTDDADIAALRRSTPRGGLDRGRPRRRPGHDVPTGWFDAVRSTANLHEPNAMVVATVGPDGRPSSRMVLLKGVDERRLRLLHQHRLAQGPGAGRPTRAARCSSRGTRSSGRCASTGSPRRWPARTSRRTSPRRPRGSRLGAWASHQSRVGRRARRAEPRRTPRSSARFADDEEVPVPEEWGGYRVPPEVVEFWQGRPGPDARPAGLPARRRRLGDGAARAVGTDPRQRTACE